MTRISQLSKRELAHKKQLAILGEYNREITAGNIKFSKKFKNILLWDMAGALLNVINGTSPYDGFGPVREGRDIIWCAEMKHGICSIDNLCFLRGILDYTIDEFKHYQACGFTARKKDIKDFIAIKVLNHRFILHSYRLKDE